MTNKKDGAPNASESRRNFMKTGTAIVAGGAVLSGGLNVARAAHAYGSDTIKIGLVGCGGRGTRAAIQAMNTSGGRVEITAMGDVFPNRMQTSFRSIKGAHADKFKVTKETQFIGYDAYKKVLASDIDLVILATPPGFRPLHVEAAINAGKHVFMEKPVAVDAPGVRRVLAAGEMAKKKDLAIAVGLQRRHEVCYRETMDRLHDGAIGDIILARAYWNGGGVWMHPRTPDQTEMEHQMKNWYYFNWLCGDHIVEQHIHNLDVINWLKQGYPVSAQGQGGRQVRKGPEHGEIFDHHMVEYTYADGTKMISQCRHIRGCWSSVTEFAHGTKGHADLSGSKIYEHGKKEPVWSTKVNHNGHQQEHHDLFADLRAGKIPNEAEYGAKSTMTAIFGRLATYSGKMLDWDTAINSDIKLADVDSMTSFEDKAPLQPNERGGYDIAVPGKFKAV